MLHSWLHVSTLLKLLVNLPPYIPKFLRLSKNNYSINYLSCRNECCDWNEQETCQQDKDGKDG